MARGNVSGNNKTSKVNKMQQSLMNVGILEETAKVATQQYMALLNVDPMLAANYAREVQDSVTGAYWAIRLMYKDKMGDEFDAEQDYMEDYISSIVSRNMDYIINSFKNNFAGDISNVDEHISYEGYESLSTADYTSDYMDRKYPERKAKKETETQPIKQVDPRMLPIKEQVRLKNSASLKEQISERMQTGIREQFKEKNKTPLKKQIRQRAVWKSRSLSKQVKNVTSTDRNKAFTSKVKSALNKAVSAIKGLFKRG